MDVGAPQHRLPLQRQRGDRTGDGVDQKLAPRQRDEIVAAMHAQRRAFEQLREGAAGVVVGDDEIVIGAAPQPHPVGGKPLAVVIDDHRQHGRAVGERRDAGDVVDAVLQHGNARCRRAEPLQPRRRRGRRVGLGAQQHPVGRFGLRRIGERGERQLDRAVRGVERQPLDRCAHAGDDVVAAGGDKTAGGDAADAAQPDHGDGQSFSLRRRYRRHAAMVRQNGKLSNGRRECRGDGRLRLSNNGRSAGRDANSRLGPGSARPRRRYRVRHSSRTWRGHSGRNFVGFAPLRSTCVPISRANATMIFVALMVRSPYDRNNRNDAMKFPCARPLSTAAATATAAFAGMADFADMAGTATPVRLQGCPGTWTLPCR